MKEWRLILPHFCFLVGVAVLLTFLDAVAWTSYICSKVTVLESSIIEPLLTIFAFLWIFGFPLWLGTSCHSCFRKTVFWAGVLLNFVVGTIGNISGILQWRFTLTQCMPDVYETAAAQQAIAASWLLLPIWAVLGGVVALIGHKKRS